MVFGNRGKGDEADLRLNHLKMQGLKGGMNHCHRLTSVPCFCSPPALLTKGIVRFSFCLK